MVSKRWKLVHGTFSPLSLNGAIPRGRHFHTLTRVSDTTAALFGGSTNDNDTIATMEVDGRYSLRFLGDCWLLDLEKAKKLKEQKKKEEQQKLSEDALRQHAKEMKR